jgi:hypothetical protein
MQKQESEQSDKKNGNSSIVSAAEYLFSVSCHTFCRSSSAILICIKFQADKRLERLKEVEVRKARATQN